jgi:putative heme-binding domain-containing protein
MNRTRLRKHSCRAAALVFLAASSPLAGWQADRPAVAGRRKEIVDGELPERNPYNSAADLALGEKLFTLRCALCHGAHGEGGRGVNLTTGQYRRGGSDREIFRTIRNGVPNSEMPRSRSDTAEVWRLAAWVKKLGSAETVEETTGDVESGRAIYSKNGCAECHIIAGQGGDMGPDLTGIGRRRSLQYLRDSILDPSADVPSQYRVDTVTTLQGRRMRGIHLNEDDYSIQLRDAAGNLHVFLKTELKSFAHEKDSMMPPYRSLRSAELEDLVGYLKSLR